MPEEIIVAIIGVETVYGRNIGSYRVIDALTTLAFDYPPRARILPRRTGELPAVCARGRHRHPGAKGSYAGAIGIPQFMPGSYRRYAVDSTATAAQICFGSFADAIGSVANFLKAHGWEAGQPVAAPAQVSGENYRKLVDAGIKPVYRVADLPAYGVTVGVAADRRRGEAAAARDRMRADRTRNTRPAPEYWVGLQNFYVLTRYNRSSFYAIAVLELAREIVQAAR